MNDLGKYNYLLSSNLGKLVKGTKLEGRNIIDSYYKIEDMDEDELKSICIQNDIRLVEEGSFEKTLAKTWLNKDEETNRQTVEMLWNKKNKDELKEIIFKEAMEKTSCYSFDDIMYDIVEINSDPKNYLLTEVNWDLGNENDHLEFSKESHPISKSKISDELCVKLTNKLKARVEDLFKSRLSTCLKQINKSTDILKDSLTNVTYVIEEGSFSDINLTLDQKKIDNSYEGTHEDELVYKITSTHFSGKIKTPDGLSHSVSHDVYFSIGIDKNNIPVVIEMSGTHI